MSHRNDLLREGFHGGNHSPNKSQLRRMAKKMKKEGKIKHYRIVRGPCVGWELYTKRR